MEGNMPKMKVSLSIGYPGATREDVLEVDDTEWGECKTSQEQEELLESYWQEWSNNYIDGGFELIP
jgi:hypothetical protein